ncbi:MAG: hypothetical protein WC429_21030, partial [Verrucomicrobiia bacterium]
FHLWKGRLASSAGRNPPQRLSAGCGETQASQSTCVAVDRQHPSNHQIALPFSSGQYNPATQRDLLRCAISRQPTLQFLAIRIS